MALRYYERKDGQGIIKKWDDADVFDKITLQTEIDEDQAKLDLPINLFNELFSEIGGSVNWQTPELYRDWLQSIIDERREFLDYYNYEKKDVTLSVADGAWFKFDDPSSQVVSVCGEEVGNESALMIDEVNTTYWQHNLDHLHEVVLKLRDYPKKMEKVRIRRFTNARSALTDLEIRVANSLGGLNDDKNIAITGASLTLDSDWNEVVFTKKQTGRYIKLTFNSQNTNNEARIREIEVRVTTMAVEF